MLILVSGATGAINELFAEPELALLARTHIGGLLGPSGGRHLRTYLNYDMRWAMDNDCFTALRRERLLTMYRANQPYAARCLWAAVPDVVGNAPATLARFKEWGPIVRSFGFPLAYVAQDGIENTTVPWHAFDCLFLGGSTAFKTGPVAERLALEARSRGKWLHMGRCSGRARMHLAGRWGVNSVDGTGFSRYGRRDLRWALPVAAAYWWTA